MKQAKPLLTIKQKCNECKKYPSQDGNWQILQCLTCKGAGFQEIEIYALRDFKVRRYFKYNIRTGMPLRNQNELLKDEYIKLSFQEQQNYVPVVDIEIPFKDYEIKRVNEITNSNYQFAGSKLISRGFKSNDKVVIRK